MENKSEIRNYYPLSYKIKLALWLLRTKIFYSRASLIRFPFDIRSRRFIDLGKGLKIGTNARLEAFSLDGKTKTLIFGNNVQANDYIHITAMLQVKIGNNVLMASKIYISDCTHGFYGEHSTSPDIPPVQRPYDIAPVTIGNNVWIGEGVCILPGTVIGNGCIIGANAVLKGTFEDNTIIVGVPAKAVKKYNTVTEKWERIKEN
ncbi:MAG: acetyltransferase [Bacteroidales bacterium]|jgi:lipopolysaccharide O-acetyltransferase|nr:acetyltransferase [Bacteroidales bacterium]